MGRQPRLIADGLVYHALNRGNNRGRVFFHDADFQQFLYALAQNKERYPFRLYAYCLMDNHFHLVLEPSPGQSISRLHTPLTEKELAAVRRSVTSGRPYGPAAWVEQTASRLGLDLAARRRGRPRKTIEK